jgi:DNA-binding protein Fis
MNVSRTAQLLGIDRKTFRAKNIVSGCQGRAAS